MVAFNERLRHLRESAALTQEGLARAAGLSVSTVVKLERGGMDPSWSTVQQLAKALGVTVLDFGNEAVPTAKPSIADAPKKPRGRPRKAQ